MNIVDITIDDCFDTNTHESCCGCKEVHDTYTVKCSGGPSNNPRFNAPNGPKQTWTACAKNGKVTITDQSGQNICYNCTPPAKQVNAGSTLDDDLKIYLPDGTTVNLYNSNFTPSRSVAPPYTFNIDAGESFSIELTNYSCDASCIVAVDITYS